MDKGWLAGVPHIVGKSSWINGSPPRGSPCIFAISPVAEI